jgi:CheY-like chemotaxis protein
MMPKNRPGPILVVEDVPNIRHLLEVTLRFKGYPVVTAGHGNEALELIREQRPALVITDILMPQLDGFGLAQKIRVDPEMQDIPIIMISATYVSKADREFALKLGAVRFLEKPVDTDEFLLTVAEILTQGPPEIPPPIPDQDFFVEYQKRLKRKLHQKNSQIQRTTRLLESLSDEQKPAFEAILQEELAQREMLQRELVELGGRVAQFEKKGTAGSSTQAGEESPPA